ncbi:MAG: 50S ribosomal protein L15 [Bdellovibrionales bacterium]|nr:50S ribosomal protein L15 [Bdellovibrionales bacterium]
MTKEVQTNKEESATEDRGPFSLESLSPEKGSRHRRKRVARGESSGWGKTAGRGNKGQLSRSGVTVPHYFEGGQMPLYRRVGKIGFRSPKQFMGLNRYSTLPVGALEQFEAGTEVTRELLEASGLKVGAKQGAGIKILGDGELTKKLTVKVEAVTKSAREKIEKAGGTVELVVARAEAQGE